MIKNKYIIKYSRLIIDKEKTASRLSYNVSTYSAGCNLAFSL